MPTGLILHESTPYVTYMPPVFDSIGDDYIRALNWRIICPECGGPVDQTYSFEGAEQTWITGEQLVREVRDNPDIQWWWGLLQGFPADVSREDVEMEDVPDIQVDTGIWTNPVSMRSRHSVVEIEAFDSSMTIVISSDEELIGRLKADFPDCELLEKYNQN